MLLACLPPPRQPTKNQSRILEKKKVLRNQQRDIEVNEYYLSRGWNVKRIWEHEIKKDFYAMIEDISNFIDNIKETNKKRFSLQLSWQGSLMPFN